MVGVVGGGGGRAATLVCRYHGWSYGPEGTLRVAPEMQEAEKFDVDSIRLEQARVAQWQGLVFANLAPDAGPEASFDAVVEGIDGRLGEVDLSSWRLARRETYELACDWKVYVENYLEGYHLPLVHPALSRVLDYRTYRTETARWHSLQWSPIDAAAGPYATGDALYYWLFPNTMINILPGRLQTNRVVPLGAGRCRVDFDYIYPAATPEAVIDADAQFAQEVQQEDTAICEAVQRGLASGVYRPGRLSPRREAGVHHFQELVRAAYRVSASSGIAET